MKTIFGYELPEGFENNVFFGAFLKSINYAASFAPRDPDFKFDRAATSREFMEFLNMRWVGNEELEHTQDALQEGVNQAKRQYWSYRIFGNRWTSRISYLLLAIPIYLALRSVALAMAFVAVILFVDALIDVSTTKSPVHPAITWREIRLEREYALELVEKQLEESP